MNHQCLSPSLLPTLSPSEASSLSPSLPPSFPLLLPPFPPSLLPSLPLLYLERAFVGFDRHRQRLLGQGHHKCTVIPTLHVTVSRHLDGREEGGREGGRERWGGGGDERKVGGTALERGGK